MRRAVAIVIVFSFLTGLGPIADGSVSANVDVIDGADMPIGLVFPISIVEDFRLEEFVLTMGINGSGIKGDPYIFEDLVLNGTDTIHGIFLDGISKHILIRNCSFTNLTTDNNQVSTYGILIEDSENIRVEYCDITGTTYGIKILRSMNCSLRSCDITDQKIHSIWPHESENIDIELVKTSDHLVGFFIRDSTNVSVNSCTVDLSEKHGAQVIDCVGVEINNSIVANSTMNSIDIESTVVNVTNCHLINGTYGIYNNWAGDIRSNIIKPRHHGIFLKGDQLDGPFDITGNMIDAVGYGISLQIRSGNISDNIISANDEGVLLVHYVYDDLDNFIMENNSLSGSCIIFKGRGFIIGNFSNNSVDGKKVELVQMKNGMKINNSANIGQIIIHGSNNTEIDNVTQLSSIVINHGEGTSISNCEIGGTYYGIITFFGVKTKIMNTHISECNLGIQIDHSGSSFISDNNISNSRIGMDLSYSEDLSIWNNTMHNCSIISENIYSNVNIPSNNTVNGLPVRFIETVNAVSIDLDLVETGQLIIINSKVHISNGTLSNGTCGILSQHSDIYINGSKFENMYAYGIRSIGTGKVEVKDSEIINCSTGIYDPQSSLLVDNCSFIGNMEEAILRHGAYSNVDISNCIFYRNGYGFRTSAEYWRHSYGSISNNIFAFNKDFAIYSTLEVQVRDNLFIENNNGTGQLSRGAKQAASTYHTDFSYVDWGNYWSDHDLTDTNDDGFADHNYRISGIFSNSVYDSSPYSHVPNIGIPEYHLVQGSSQITVNITNWTSTEDLEHTGFRIYRSEDRINWINIADIPLNITEYADSDVANGYAYHYKVVCLGKLPGYSWTGEGYRGPILNETPDRIAPEIDFISPRQGSFYGGHSMNIAWNVTDNQDRLKKVMISSNGSEWMTARPSGIYTMKGLSNGSYHFSVRAIDEAGNVAERSISFIMDNDDPIFDLIHPLDGSYVTETPLTLKWNMYDPTSEITEFHMKIDGHLIDIEWGTDEYTFDPSIGDHRLEFFAKDRVQGSIHKTYSFIVDDIPPSLTITSPLPGRYVNKDLFKVELVMNDHGSGVSSLYYQIDLGPWKKMPSDRIIQSGYLAHGEHTLKVQLEDVAGNLVTDDVDFLVDRKRPEIKMVTPTSGYRTGTGSCNIMWLARDLESGLDRYMVTTEEEVPTIVVNDPGIMFANVKFLEDGIHTVTVECFDRSGNSAKADVKVIMDTIRPEIISFTPEGYNNSVDSRISILFSEEMDRGTISVEVLLALNISLSWGIDRLYVTFDDDLMYSTTYGLYIEGSDLAGNPMGKQFFSFRTLEVGSIELDIVNENGMRLTEALIFIDGEELSFHSRIDGYGKEFEPGDYKISISCEGYMSYSASITVHPGRASNMGKILLIPVVQIPVEEKDNGPLVLLLILLSGGILSISFLFYFLRNRGSDRDIDIEIEEKEYNVDRGSKDEEHLKHDANIEQAKNDLW